MKGKLYTLFLFVTACFLICAPSRVKAQSETHNFVTYDTTFTNSPGDVWNARISRPSGLFGNGPDTASRPLIIMMPGQGQMGSSNPNLLTQYGPHYWLNNGWDGSVQLGNGTHYPIIITVNHVSNVYPQPYQFFVVLTFILAHYHVKANSVYGSGLSEGAFTTGGIIEYEKTLGDHAGMKLYKAMAIFEGTPTTPTTSFPTTPTTCSAQWCDTSYYKTWASQYGGRYFYLEGSGTDNFRDGWHYAAAMNNTVPNSGYFSYENLGGGAHCCWNSMYDPSAHNWTSVGTLGPNNAPSQAGTNSMGDYQAGSNVYQWMMRQGDTSLVGSGAPPPATPPTVSAGTTQTITLPSNSVTLSGSATANNGGSIASYSWTQVSGGAGVITSSASASTTVTGLAAGTYVFKLVATDNTANTASATVQVVVNAAAVTAPVVSAGSNQGITMPTSTVTLNGSATSSSSTIVSYQWSVVSGGPATITSATSAVTSVTGLSVGTWVLKLTATDALGNSASATVQVVVNAVAVPSACSVYYWDTTNIAISLTNANYPNIKPCDTIYIDPCKTQAGYRNVKIKLSSSTPWKYSTLDSNRINLIFRGGYIKPNPSGNLFENSIDASNNLLIQGLKMYDHTDPLFSSVTSTGYLHHIKFVQDTLQNTPGLWGSGPISTSLPNFTGNGDTTNCNYDIWFHQCVFDSIGNTSYGGLTTIWLGGLKQNQVFVKTEIDNCFFNYAPSPVGSGPACFIHAQQAYFTKIHDNTFSNLGIVPFPQGHAASIFMQGSLFNIYHNIFRHNFSNCVRAISQGTVPGMNSLFASWDATYDGVSRFWGNILDSGRKYPMIEDQMDTVGVSGLPYYVNRRSARIWNNTMYRGGTGGGGNSPYNVSLYDWYKVAYTQDTLEMHNNVEVGPPMDTTATMCYSQACVALLTKPNNGVPIYDTAGNQFYQLMTLATSGFADAVHFYPLLNGLLYNNGTSVPAWLNTDFYGQPVPTTGRAAFAKNTGVDVGAVQEYSGMPSPPTANPGPNQTITLPINSVILVGSGSETGGTIVSYAWTQVSGPSTANIGSASLATTTVGSLVQGTYTFQLTVKDNSGVTASATVQVIVNPAAVVPGPPSANAGATQTITLPTNSVTLTGSGSETNGTIVSYAWTQLSGPSTAAIGSAGQATTIVSSLVQGTYTFQLTVKDNSGVTASATVQVIINPAAVVPGPPSANAGATQTITLPTNSVTLVGSGSETNGTIVSYAWTQLSGPSTAVIGSAGQATTTVGSLVQGTYRFQLTVTDNSGVTATATVQVVVNPAAVVPGPPSANAGSDQTITLPVNSVSLTGSGSETNGTIVSYAWTQVSGPSTAVIGSAGQATTTVDGLVQGVYKFQLTVTDNSGVTASDVVFVTVNAAIVPGPPSANAGSTQTITLPTNSVTLTGSGSETNGTIVSYAWTQLSGPSTATLGSAGQATTTADALVQGTYRFQLTVTDNSGIIATATVQVIVNPAAVVPGPPSANAGSDQTITLPANSVTLTGNGSETNGTIVSYAWTQVSGPSTAAIGSAGQATTTVSSLVQGVYKFQLTVTDNSAVTASDVVYVTVNPAVAVPGTPSADAGAPQTITLPTNSVTLTGSGSESGGTIVSYAWTQLSGPSTAVIGSAGQATTTVGSLVQGTYRFQLTVTDNSGVTATATVQVVVNPAAVVPGPPSANAGSDQTIMLPVNSASLTGSGNETNGTIVSYAWTQVSGPSTAVIGSAGQATTTVSGLVQGVYKFQLTVTDNSGVTASDVVFVTVNAAVVPGPPSANAGTTQTITLPTNSVTLVGGGSETNGTIVSYAWTQLSGPSTATLGSAGQATTTADALVQGTYRFQLTVTDNSGVTAKSTVQVIVNPAAVVPGPPSANAGSDQTIILPTNSVTLTGNGSETNGTIVSYAWTQVSGPSTAVIGSAGQATTTVSSLVQGVYKFQLTVTDNSGVTASDVVFVTVNPHQPPVANAGPDQSTTLTSGIQLDGSASYDPGGTIVSYTWVQVSGLGGITIGGENTVSPTLYGLAPGVYVFQLTVTDNAGLSASDEVTITVTAGGGADSTSGAAPVAVVGKDTTVYYPNNDTAMLNGSASYATTGTITGYTWTQLSGPNEVLIANSGSAVGMVAGLAPGNYTFSLTVTGSSGATSTATMTVHVLDQERTSDVVQLYPNPVQVGQQVTITGSNGYAGQVKFIIMDIRGNVVKTVLMDKQAPYFTQTINVSGFSRGTYVILMQFYMDKKPLALKLVVN